MEKIIKNIGFMKYIKRFESIDWNFIDEENSGIMPEFEGNEDFYNFLVENDALDKYTKNFKGKKLKFYLKINNKRNFINFAFTWDETSDGHNYWLNLYKKWKNKLMDET